MVLKVYTTGQQTMAAATQTFNTSRIKGQIMKIEVVASASTDFAIWVDASDDNTSAIVDQNILGTVASKITVNTTLVVYPVVAQYTGANNTITDPDQYIPMIVDDVMEVAVASGAAADTWTINIYYDDMQSRVQ